MDRLAGLISKMKAKRTQVAVGLVALAVGFLSNRAPA